MAGDAIEAATNARCWMNSSFLPEPEGPGQPRAGAPGHPNRVLDRGPRPDGEADRDADQRGRSWTSSREPDGAPPPREPPTPGTSIYHLPELGLDPGP